MDHDFLMSNPYHLSHIKNMTTIRHLVLNIFREEISKAVSEPRKQSRESLS